MNGEARMKRDYTGNQRGEVVTGLMIVIMCGAMMIFGGMSNKEKYESNIVYIRNSNCKSIHTKG